MSATSTEQWRKGHAALSRGCAGLMMHEPFYSLSTAELRKFLNAFEKAGSFTDLPKSYQAMVLQAEKARKTLKG
jgi:hypothetical protein